MRIIPNPTQIIQFQQEEQQHSSVEFVPGDGILIAFNELNILFNTFLHLICKR